MFSLARLPSTRLLASSSPTRVHLRELHYAKRLEGRTIRLLRLELDTYKAPIRCHLVEASLDDLPPYEALSYVWGDAEVTEAIICDSQIFHATTNLVRALRKIRLGISPPNINVEAEVGTIQAAAIGPHGQKPTVIFSISTGTQTTSSQIYRPQLLWVDALCINQTDTSERNDQVQLMGEIFSKAVRVIIWLGDKHVITKQMALMTVAVRIVASKFRLGQVPGQVDPNDFDKFNDYSLDDLIHDLGEPSDAVFWSALNAVFSSDWYSRVWCIQEAVLAHNSVVLYRNVELDSGKLFIFGCWFCRHFTEVSWEMSSSIPVSLGYASQMFAPQQLRKGMWQDPATVLGTAKNLQAKDPRDKFYGLLGLIGSDGIKVDYNKSVIEMYKESVLYAANQDLDILSHVYHPPHGEETMRIPSWVPDWNSEALACALRTDSAPVSRQPVSKLDRTLAHTGILQLHGLSCDYVSSVVEFLRPIDDRRWPALEEQSGNLLHEVFKGLWQEKLIAHGSSSISLYSWAKTLISGDYYFGRLTRDHPEIADERLMLDFTAFLRMLLPECADTMEHAHRSEEDGQNFYTIMLGQCRHRRIFHTSKNWLGLGPECMQPGDLVAVFHGATLPHILRPVKDRPDHYWLMGACYVHSLIDEAAYGMIGKEGVEERVFNLV